MSTNRFSTLLIVLMLAVVAVLSVRTAISAGSSTYEMDSATRSYIAWGEAIKNANVENIMVPVTKDRPAIGAVDQPNIAWVKACGADLSYVNNASLSSATRSYIAWAKYMQCGGNEE